MRNTAMYLSQRETERPVEVFFFDDKKDYLTHIRTKFHEKCDSWGELYQNFNFHTVRYDNFLYTTPTLSEIEHVGEMNVYNSGHQPIAAFPLEMVSKIRHRQRDDLMNSGVWVVECVNGTYGLLDFSAKTMIEFDPKNASKFSNTVEIVGDGFKSTRQEDTQIHTHFLNQGGGKTGKIRVKIKDYTIVTYESDNMINGMATNTKTKSSVNFTAIKITKYDANILRVLLREWGGEVAPLVVYVFDFDSCLDVIFENPIPPIGHRFIEFIHYVEIALRSYASGGDYPCSHVYCGSSRQSFAFDKILSLQQHKNRLALGQNNGFEKLIHNWETLFPTKDIPVPELRRALISDNVMENGSGGASA
tara:strand:- start:341 stop:1423 length:1083 start_codon:yes stop_codon:yes gene_type:complete